MPSEPVIGEEPSKRFMRRIDPREQRHFERVVQGYVKALGAPRQATSRWPEAVSAAIAGAASGSRTKR